MKRGIILGLAVALMTSLGLTGPAIGEAVPTVLSSAGTGSAKLAPAVVSASLVVRCRAANPTCWPTSFAFTPDGRIFYVERLTGQVRIYNPRTRRDGLWKTIGPLSTNGEQGLLGLTLDPSFATSGWVYAYFTQPRPVNHIIRLKKNPDGSFSYRSLKWVPAGQYHNGGKIRFGPDRNLYAVTGETGNPSLAQDKSSLSGKVLRMTWSGYVPSGNPFRNLVFSYGHRNSFGIAFDPVTKLPWESENGPECNDEINRIIKGANFGWGPHETCSSPPSPPANTNQDGPNPVLPLAWYTPTIAPTGVAFCNNCGLPPAAEGALLMGSWNDNAIRAITLTADRLGVVSSTVIYTHGAGILDLEAGPGGIYFSSPGGIYRLVSA
jgi:glucose/arabinose dehydrogenase